MAKEPTIFDALTTAINASEIKTSVSIDADAKKTLKTLVFTVSAALVIAAVINSRRR
jgi:hypothetical protein